MKQPQAILVLPHLRIQNANAIGSPLTHGFPSITAFTGVMWALQRKLAQAGVPLQLQGVRFSDTASTSVICRCMRPSSTMAAVLPSLPTGLRVRLKLRT